MSAKPMASYLVTADIGRWIVRQGRTPGGIPEYVAVDPVLPDVTTTERGVTKTRTAVDFFYEESARAADLWTQKFGPYPFDVVGAIACLSGACAMYRRDAFLLQGGLDVGPGEDLEFTLRLRRLGYVIRFVPGAWAETGPARSPLPPAGSARCHGPRAGR